MGVPAPVHESYQHDVINGACQYAFTSYILSAKRCYIAFNFYTKLTSTAEISDNNKTYVLPDENIITVGAERLRFAEVLFQLSFSARGASGIHNNSWLILVCLGALIHGWSGLRMSLIAP